MVVLRMLVSGMGGMAGVVAWYLGMKSTGLWPIFIAALYDQHSGDTLALFAGSCLLCGLLAASLALFLGERLRLFPSREKLDQHAKPVSLFSREGVTRR